MVPAELPQGAYLDPAERLDAVIGALAPEHLPSPGFQVNLAPRQCDKLADAQAVAVGAQGLGRVPMPPAAPSAGRIAQLGDFRFGVRYWRRERSWFVPARPSSTTTVPFSVFGAVSVAGLKPADCPHLTLSNCIETGYFRYSCRSRVHEQALKYDLPDERGERLSIPAFAHISGSLRFGPR